MRKGYNKFKNNRVEAYGIKFDSEVEQKRYEQLQALAREGVIWNLVSDKSRLRFRIEVNGQKICDYEADFSYTQKLNGVDTYIVEDVKGVETPVYKLKKKLMKAIYGIEIRQIKTGARYGL